MSSEIFNSVKSNQVYKDDEEYYLSSIIEVGKECVTLDMYYQSDKQNARDEAKDVRGYLVKQDSGFSKVVRVQPNGRIIGLGSMKDGFYDTINIESKGSYRIMVKANNGLDIFRNFRMSIFAS